MTDLKPCPFCGGKASMAYWAQVSCVVCQKCGAMGAMVSDSYEAGDGKEKAAEAWNRRADNGRIH